jgi:hypothetical protein
MANIQQVINIFENVGNAMVGVHKFIYGDRAQIDAFQAKSYPVILLERNVPVPTFNIQTNRSRINLRIQFYDLYHRKTAAKEKDQDPQRSLELLSYQYLKEVNRLMLENGRVTIVNRELTGGSYAFNVGSDKLIRLEMIIPIDVFGECSEGQFNYLP